MGIEYKAAIGAPVSCNSASQIAAGADVPVVVMIAGKAGSSEGVHKRTKI